MLDPAIPDLANISAARPGESGVSAVTPPSDPSSAWIRTSAGMSRKWSSALRRRPRPRAERSGKSH